MRILLMLMLMACDSSDTNTNTNVCGDRTKLPVCVPGQYETVIVTDGRAPCYSDPRCGTALVQPGEHCNFQGLACEFFDATIACDCDGIAHCHNDPNNTNAKCEATPDLAVPESD